jgi:hypothetical protein
VGVSSPATIDSSVLLPEPRRADHRSSFPWRQREIDIAQNVEGAGRIGDRFVHVLDRNDGI